MTPTDKFGLFHRGDHYVVIVADDDGEAAGDCFDHFDSPVFKFEIQDDGKYQEAVLWIENEKFNLTKVKEIHNKDIQAEIIRHIDDLQEKLDIKNEDDFDVWEDQRDSSLFYAEF